MVTRSILLTIFLILSTVTVYDQSDRPTPTPTKTARPYQEDTQAQQTKTDDKHDNSPQIIVESTGTTQAKESKETNRRDYTYYFSASDWVFNFLLVIFTGLLAYFTRTLAKSTLKLWKTAEQQGKDLRQSIEINRRSAVAAEIAAAAAHNSAKTLPEVERAYLFVTKIHNNARVVHITVENKGKTPASNVDVCAALLVGKDVCCDERCNVYRPTTERNSAVGAGERYETNITFYSSEWGISEAELLDNCPYLVLYGHVNYKDIFGWWHLVRFCWHHDPENVGTGSFFRRCAKENWNCEMQ